MLFQGGGGVQAIETMKKVVDVGEQNSPQKGMDRLQEEAGRALARFAEGTQ